MLVDMATDADSPADSSARGANDAGSSPKDLTLKLKEQVLHVEWADGVRSTYSLATLRRNCPCATCRTERESQSANPLRILKSDPVRLRVTNAKLVGNYAIQFEWSDGHNTGIFDFRFLRGLSAAQET